MCWGRGHNARRSRRILRSWREIGRNSPGLSVFWSQLGLHREDLVGGFPNGIHTYRDSPRKLRNVLFDPQETGCSNQIVAVKQQHVVGNQHPESEQAEDRKSAAEK